MFRHLTVAALIAAILAGSLTTPTANAAEPVYLAPSFANAKTSLHTQLSKFNATTLSSGYKSQETKNEAPRSSNNLSESVATLNHHNTPQIRSKLIELNTKASALGTYRNASAELRTSESVNGGLQWVWIRVGPGSSNDRQGKPVAVTLRLKYTGTISGSTGRNRILVGYTDGSPHARWWADGSMTNSQSYNGTRTFSSRVGSTFAVCLYNQSTATRDTTATSNIQLTVNVD